MTADEIPEIEKVMEELLYEHLVDLVDFDRMYQLEQIIYCQLARHEDGDDDDDDDDDEMEDIEVVDQRLERVDAIFKRAWVRLIDDPRRHIDMRGEWEPDDDCEICKVLASPPQERAS